MELRRGVWTPAGGFKGSFSGLGVACLEEMGRLSFKLALIAINLFFPL